MNRDLLLIMMYLLNKGDYFRFKAKESSDKLKTDKILSAAEFEQIYRDLLANEIFDEIQYDLCRLLNIIP